MAWWRKAEPIREEPVLVVVADPEPDEPVRFQHLGDPELRAGVTRAMRLAGQRVDPRAQVQTF